VRVTGARSVATGGAVVSAAGVGVVGGSVVGGSVVATGVDIASSATAPATPIAATRPNIVATPRPALTALDPLAA
jgi:hypothetical protein